MGFENFFNLGGDKIKRYEAMLPTATEEEKREFESELLIPLTLPNFSGEQPTADAMEDLTARLVFSNEEEAALFNRHFKVSQYIEKSCHDLRLLIGLLELVEEGKIEYNAGTGSVRIVVRETTYQRRAKVGQ